MATATMNRETAAKYLRQWRTDDVMLQFARALAERDGESFDWAYFMDRPEKWADEYAVWVNAGKPRDHTESGWAQFEEVS